MKLITISWIRVSFWLFCSLFISTPVLAQVTPDGTTSTTVNADGNNFEINNGDRDLGNNLFHSFQDFSVPNGGEAFFNSIIANNIEVDGGENGIFTGLFAQVGSEATGQGGSIIIGSEQSPVERLSVTNGAQISVSTSGEGDAGNLSILANNVEVDGGENGFFTGLFAQVNSAEATGQGGSIIIGSEQSPVERLSVTNGARISVDTSGEGDAGNLFIFANDLVEVIGNSPQGRSSSIRANVSSTGQAQGGNLIIDTDKLITEEGGQISASTLGTGNAGRVSISANEILLDGESTVGFNSGIFSTIEPDASGSAGDINIETTNLTITNGAEIDTSTLGKGNGGNIKIEASDTITLDGKDRIEDENGFRSNSGIFANVELNASGDAGNIDITSNNLIIHNSAEINVNSEGQGVGGNLSIKISDLELDSGSLLSSTSFEEGGNIELKIADNLILRDNSLISAEATQMANGGNLTIDTRFIIAFPSEGDGNDITASAEQGDGGTINITAESLFGIAEGVAIPGNNTNDIDASSDFGLFGNVTINISNVNALEANTELPDNPIESEQTVAQTCQSDRLAGRTGGLTIKGRGGIPPEPTEPLNSDTILVDGEITDPDLQTQHPEIKPIKTSRGDIIPARGIVKTEDGRVILTAYPTDNLDTRTPQIRADCTH